MGVVEITSTFSVLVDIGQNIALKISFPNSALRIFYFNIIVPFNFVKILSNVSPVRPNNLPQYRRSCIYFIYHIILESVIKILFARG